MGLVKKNLKVRLWPEADPKPPVLGCLGLASASDPKQTSGLAKLEYLLSHYNGHSLRASKTPLVLEVSPFGVGE
jgi:hypothetical protein